MKTGDKVQIIGTSWKGCYGEVVDVRMWKASWGLTHQPQSFGTKPKVKVALKKGTMAKEFWFDEKDVRPLSDLELLSYAGE